MPAACCLIRSAPHYRADAFQRGLLATGHRLVAQPSQADVLVIWNRYGAGATAADQVEARGGTVLVAENAYLGNDFAGSRWYALAKGQHNGAGAWPQGGPDRWDALGIELAPWRSGGAEIVLLPQRGIGPAGIAMPAGWAEAKCRQLRGRIRPHPGKYQTVPLQQDLQRARCVWTWGSSAALKALRWGIPAHGDMPRWIGHQDNTDEGRLAMFRRLAWAQWTLQEIENGDALARVLAC
jgi:hypothetical protein